MGKVTRIYRDGREHKRRRPWHFRRDKWPYDRKWLWGNKKIKARLVNPKDRSLFKMLKILEYLWDKRLRLAASKVLSFRVEAGMYHKKEHEWTYVMCAPIDYEYLNQKGISKVLLHHYLKAMVEAGFLKSFRRAGRNGQTTYAIGFYIENSHAPHGHGYPFLANTKEFRNALINFKIKGEKQ